MARAMCLSHFDTVRRRTSCRPADRPPVCAIRGLIISGEATKPLSIETIVPADIERFPWSGHLGTRLLADVIGCIERARTTLIFTNTRSQAEIWFRSLLRARPDWAAELALHHGSLDRDIRAYVEDRLRAGTIRAVVCTSSLDLGVDFSPVDQVLQVGSPKGIARLLQRAGRSGHQPVALSRSFACRHTPSSSSSSRRSASRPGRPDRRSRSD